MKTGKGLLQMATDDLTSGQRDAWTSELQVCLCRADRWTDNILQKQEHRMSCQHTKDSDQMSLWKLGLDSIPNCCQHMWCGLSGQAGREEVSAKSEHREEKNEMKSNEQQLQTERAGLGQFQLGHWGWPRSWITHLSTHCKALKSSWAHDKLSIRTD